MHPDPQSGRREIVMTVLSQIGTPYRWGGASPATGFDCSGLVTFVFGKALSLSLPRTARSQAEAGHLVVGDLEPADLVFFNTRGQSYSHVGIYIGDQTFVHAPNSSSPVRSASLDNSYWSSHFDGARRIII